MTTSTEGNLAKLGKDCTPLTFRLTAMPLFNFRHIAVLSRLPGIINRARRCMPAMALAAALTTLAGCGMLRIGYNSAADLGYYWLDSYVDFDKPQSRRVKAELNALHRWHRKEELPRVAELLVQAQTLVLQSPDGARLCTMYDSVLQRSQALAKQAMPAAVAIIPSLKPEQLATLAQAYEKSNRKMLGEWRDAHSKGMDLRTLKSLERLEDLYGNLSAEQRNVFKARMSENGFDEQKYQQELRSRQQTVLQTLGRLRGADAATAEATLSELNSLFYESADPAYRQHNEQVLAKTCHAFAALHAQTNAEQRSHMLKRLKDYENELRALILQKAD